MTDLLAGFSKFEINVDVANIAITCYTRRTGETLNGQPIHKNSFHIKIHPDIVMFDNNKLIKLFRDHVLDMSNPKYYRQHPKTGAMQYIIDTGVYTMHRAFRLPGCHKVKTPTQTPKHAPAHKTYMNRHLVLLWQKCPLNSSTQKGFFVCPLWMAPPS